MNKHKIYFTTEMQYTFEEYVRCSDRVCRFSNFMSYALWFGIGGILIAFLCLRKDYTKALFMLMICVTRALRGKPTKKKKQREMYKSLSGINLDNDDSYIGGNYRVGYEFYSDHFYQIWNGVRSEPIRYYDLLKIIETKTNFYLMYEAREGCIIVKENCSRELNQFLHNLKCDPKSPIYNKHAEAKISYDKTTASILEKIGCPCEILEQGLSLDEKMERYRLAVETSKQNGYPVIVPAEKRYLKQLKILEEDGYDREALLHRNLSNGKQLLITRYRGNTKNLEQNSEYMGELKNGEIITGREALESFGGKWEEFILFKVPVDEPWKIPAYVPIKVSNSDLSPEQILAVCRYWYETYQAVPAIIGPDTMVFTVGKEVHSKRDALELAREHLGFCENCVYLCTKSGTLTELTDSIQKSKAWYFRWN